MRKFGFIFARGGSKGIKDKNLQILDGISLTERSINFALDLGIFEEIFLSTDSQKLSNIALKKKIQIIKRPKKISTDSSKEIDAWKHAIKYVYKLYGKFDIFISLPTTSPFKKKKFIYDGLNILSDKNVDLCIPISKSSRNPYFNMVRKKKFNKNVEIAFKSKKIYNRQQAPQLYDISTMFYISRPDFILKNDYLFNGKVSSIEIEKQLALDIDDLNDLKYAEYLINNNQKLKNFE